jgi:hypothetical protein
MENKKNSHIGKKILYGFVIAMSGLILLLSSIGIIGAWAVEQPISNSVVAVLKVVENSASIVQVASGKVDQSLAALQAKVTDITDASNKISQNVTDKGLVLVLLPESKEQQVVDTANAVRDTFNGYRETITRGLDLYRSVNRIPFVSLPGPSEEQMAKIESSLTKIQTLADTLRTEVANFRTGVSGKIDKVAAAADLLSKEIQGFRDSLAQFDSFLTALGAILVRLQQVIPEILFAVAAIVTLLYAFVIFTQVEVIRLYVARWRLLGKPQNELSTKSPAQTAQEGEGVSESK